MHPAKRIPQFLLLSLGLLTSSCVSLNSDPNQIKTAISVPHLTLYVRTPYTSPAQLVKIENVSPEGTMICPYTKRPFIVPGYAKRRPLTQTSAARTGPRKKAAATESAVMARPDAKPQKTAAKAEETTPAPAAPSMIEPQLDEAATEALPVPPMPASDKSQLPYGIRIPGQKDFVRSPFAAAHQLVDVTSLPIGSEVKCPYSGKLFRVPPLD